MKINESCILEDRGIIYIEGPDTNEFLQNIITNDLNKVSDKQSIFSSLLTPQGKYLFDFMVVKHKKGYLLDCEKNIEGMYICGDMNQDCPGTTGEGENATFDMEFLYELSWTRFGNIKLERFDNKRKIWVVQ